MSLFVVVMAVGSKDFYMDFSLKDLIDKSVFPRYLPAPSVFGFPLQRLRMPQACSGMFVEFANEPYGLIIHLWLTVQQTFQIFLRLFFNDNCIMTHKPRIYLSSSSTLEKLLPGCFSALSNLAKNSSLVIKVGSSFSFTSFLAYRVRRLISGSLSAIAPMLCQSSVFIVFNCTAVIISG